MTWSYSGNPEADAKDQVRFLIGDTDTRDQMLQDEEINFLLKEQGSARKAAVEACVNIMAKLAREVDYALGPEKVNASQRLENYQKLHDKLRSSAISSNASPSWTGEGVSENALFDVGMHDYYGGDDGGPLT